MQDPSLPFFQHRMEDELENFKHQTLFGTGPIPTDNTIRNLLDGCPPDAFDTLFRRSLDIFAAQDALQPYQRLDGRILIAPDGVKRPRLDPARPEDVVVVVDLQQRPRSDQGREVGGFELREEVRPLPLPVPDIGGSIVLLAGDERGATRHGSADRTRSSSALSSTVDQPPSERPVTPIRPRPAPGWPCRQSRPFLMAS